MAQYKYRPVRFYLTCFAITWACWIAAAVLSRTPNDNGLSIILMLFGLIAPSATAMITVLTSGCKALKQDLKRKIVGFYRIKPLNILLASVIEETAWRGYGEDAVGSYFSWFTESIIFGSVWAL